ncbi:copper-transporting ATPase PAA2, chloroplastic-like isoform X2 [Zingiber officinale]|uniref:copper-transporting ATPase PAA2, chloroplastic-like isoform X2 n=1 Tax=Zingiber officinale TaxID=94328 RepID=UPI001C4AB1D8|nr:copper-transporting ATPase PAA2, chloroplastic-like isoform X2 [Zingiber officinale]
MAAALLRLTVDPNSKLLLGPVRGLRTPPPHLRLLRWSYAQGPLRLNAIGIDAATSGEFHQDLQIKTSSSVLLEVGGMMCGGCAARVRSLLSADDRVESAVVNMLTETAAVRLRSGGGEPDLTAEHLAGILTQCGFPSKRRRLGLGVRENVAKWKDMSEKKEKLLAASRNRVVFAWTLVALCCGSHASHLLHSFGIHVAHGFFWDLLHNSYVKGGIALGSLLGPGRDLLLDGFRAFANVSPNMNSLVGFGSVAAFMISAMSVINPGLGWEATFFDEPVMLLGFVLLGRSLEERARLKASSDMNELMSLISSQSRLLITSSEENSSSPGFLSADAISIEIPTDDVRIGDTVLVLPGETIPVDDGPLKVKAVKTGAMSTISKIVHMVEEAQAQQAPIQRLADLIAGPFVYSVMGLSAATFVFWYYFGTQIFPDVLLNDIAGSDAEPLLLSLKLSVDVLVVSCPCALGLATPTAILVGTSLGARKGLLIRGGDVLERLSDISVIAFDKTGTLTDGKPVVIAIASLTNEDSEILRLAAAVEKTASHPIAMAILDKAELLNLGIPSTSGQLTEPGFGSLAEVDGSLVAVGRLDWVHERFQQKTTESELLDLDKYVECLSSNMGISSNQSKTVVYVGKEGEGIIGAIVVADVLRQDANITVGRLQEMGIRSVLVSGDREEAVRSVGKMVGIENTHASLTPQQKSNIISNLKAEGHRVAMVGDGINDAPSLALADVGVALQIESKDNAASNAASVILLGNRLSQIVDAISLAKATMAKVHQNLAWAVAYNVVAIPIAAGVLLPKYDFAMTPSLSGGLMALSSIFVVSNSLLLQLHGSSSKKDNC